MDTSGRLEDKDNISSTVSGGSFTIHHIPNFCEMSNAKSLKNIITCFVIAQMTYKPF